MSDAEQLASDLSLLQENYDLLRAEIDELRSLCCDSKGESYRQKYLMLSNQYTRDIEAQEAENTRLKGLLGQALGALRGVENLIEHQFNGTRDAMSTLQNVADDCQMVLTALEKEGIK